MHKWRLATYYWYWLPAPISYLLTRHNVHLPSLFFWKKTFCGYFGKVHDWWYLVHCKQVCSDASWHDLFALKFYPLLSNLQTVLHQQLSNSLQFNFRPVSGWYSSCYCCCWCPSNGTENHQWIIQAWVQCWYYWCPNNETKKS